MNKSHLRIALLWGLGVLAIPLGLVFSGIMNYLTGVFQSQAISQDFSIAPVAILFLLSVIALAALDVTKIILKGVDLEASVRLHSLTLFEKIIKAKPEFFRRTKTAKISNRIVVEVRNVETFKLDLKVGLPVTVIGLLIFSYVLFFGVNEHTPLIGEYLPSNFNQNGNYFLAALILLLSPVQAYFLLFDKKLQRMRKASAVAFDDMTAISYETVNCVQEFRGNYAFSYAISRMSRVFGRIRNVEMEGLKIKALFGGIGPILDGIVRVLLLAIGAYLCVSELSIFGFTVTQIEWKDYMGFSGMAMMVNGYVGQLKAYLFQSRVAKESFRRIEEFENAESLIDTSTQNHHVDGIKEVLSFNQLDYRADGGLQILSNINLTINPGEHIALVGPSGCGKSTILNLISQEIAPSQGELKFSEELIQQCDIETLSSEIGFVRQKPLLIDSSIRDNLLLGLRTDKSPGIYDSSGPISLARLSWCSNLDDLDREVIKSVEKVSLTVDVIKKGLSNLIPPAFMDGEIVSNFESIRNELSNRVAATDPQLIISFSGSEFLPHVSLMENVLYGDIVRQCDNPSEARDAMIDSISHYLFSSRLGDLLVLFGLHVFSTDEQVAKQTKVMSPDVYDAISVLNVLNLGSLEQLKLYLDGKKSLTKIRRETMMKLITIALNSPGMKAGKVFRECNTFFVLLNDARKKLNEQRDVLASTYIRFDSEKSLLNIPLREALLGGVVNKSIRDSLQSIDKIILSIFAERNIRDELILMGLESPVGENGLLLSGGQAMKVSIARVLLKKPNLILMDEATASLDEDSQAHVIRLIEQDYRGKTVIMVSHRLSAIKNFDRILVCDRGQIVQQGTYAELVREQGLFSSLVNREHGSPLRIKEPALEKQKNTIQEPINGGPFEVMRALSLSPVFSGLTSYDLNLIEKKSKRISVKKGEILFRRGDQGKNFFLVIRGGIDFFVTDSKTNQVKIIDSCSAGDSFGELALFGEGKRTLGAMANCKSELCTISHQVLSELLKTNPQLSKVFLRNMAKTLADIRDYRYSSE